MIEIFHFIRPLWLALLPLIGLAWWLARRRESAAGAIAPMLAPHLQEALTLNRNARGGIRAVDGVALVMLAATLAAAGPTWTRQPSPWFEETAPLVIAVEVSDSMRSNDLLPTRLDRARFKILDLVAQRTGSRNALVAYSGSAHIVVPPTRDIDVLKPLLESLDPAIMPEPGANAAAVLSLAVDLLGEQAAIGTVLFVTDGFDPADIPALADFSARTGSPALAALVVGTEEGGVALLPDGSPVLAGSGGRLDTRIDTALLRRAASEAGVEVVRAGTGDADIRQLQRAVESSLRRADDPDAQWRDEGWWLLWPALLLALPWFRRGWTMRW